MKAARLLAGIVLLAISVVGTTAQAATYVNFTCGCKVESEGERCVCYNALAYELCAFCTKEFRGQCTGIADVSPNDVNNYHADMDHLGMSEVTTCTVTLGGFGYYTSSCTNWSVTKKDTIYINLGCLKQHF